MSKRVIVIGSGFAGLSSACDLAHKGYEVTVLEKNSTPGGRASRYTADGFIFDMGPSWYWMPDVFERFFERFGKKVTDYYELDRLDPGYRIFYGKNDTLDVPASMDELYAMFEELESGSSKELKKFLKDAEYKYQVGINDLVYRPSRSVMEFADVKLLRDLFRLQLFSSIKKDVRSRFKNKKLIELLEFPVYFLGALPENTPALYSLMNYADLALGTWYPRGGMFKIVEGMVALAEELGVSFKYDQNVTRIEVSSKKARKVITDTDEFHADVVVSAADYHHVEQQLLEKPYRKYDESYWDSRIMAPSSLIFFLGINKKIPKLEHHNLFFDRPFELFAKEIYEEPQWPSDPLFYTSVVSKTDPLSAPEGMENVFILIPVAPDLEDNEATRERYYHMVIERLEEYTGESLKEHVVHKRSFAHKDFKDRYNSYKGNAYGLANTLLQTAIFKPSLKNGKVNNLYFAGQLTVPGPGVPPSIISGLVVGEEVLKEHPIKK